MELKLAEKIVNICLHNSSHEIELREDYSGRGMFGKTTAAVIVEYESAITEAIGSFLVDASEDDIEEINELGALMEKGYRTDSLGMRTIIY